MSESDLGPGRSGEPAPGLVTIVGLASDRLETLDPDAADALARAGFVAGGRRHLEAWSEWLTSPEAKSLDALEVPSFTIGADADAAARAVAVATAGGAPACVLASGDPGFFGILRALGRVIDRRRLLVLPAPSSVSLAFARFGLPWDDAAVVSAHGRPLADAIAAACLAEKAAVLTSPENPPERVAGAFVDAGATAGLSAVCSRLGFPDESVHIASLADLASGHFDPLSVLVVADLGGGARVPGGTGTGSDRPPRSLAWGLADDRFLHRNGMVTKSEVRAVALGKLDLPPRGVLWDIGAGSGSVAIECSRLVPDLEVFAVEESSEDTARLGANARSHRVNVTVVVGRAPSVLADLPDPDRVFVGGGGVEVLEAAMARLRPGGRIVATYAALERAADGAERLGNMVQITAQRGRRLPGGGWRLAAMNPVFVTWGPGAEPVLDLDDAIPGTRP